MKKIILLSGRKRTGKGTLYSYASKLFSDIEECFFAKPLKDFCINALGLTHEQMYGNSEERESLTNYKWGDVATHIRQRYLRLPEDCMTAREVIQVVGSDVMRDNFDKAVWAKAGAREVLKSKAKVCFFTDVRMENEITAIKDVANSNSFDSPLVIRLLRKTGLKDNHISETALDRFDAFPDQRTIEEGLPTGFLSVAGTRLWTNYGNPSNPFNFILDNNGTVDEAEQALHYIIKHML